MSESLKILREISEGELIKKHDELAGSTQVGVNHYLQEIARRDQDKQTRAMLTYTKRITIMTLIIAGLTILNVLVAVILLMKTG